MRVAILGLSAVGICSKVKMPKQIRYTGFRPNVSDKGASRSLSSLYISTESTINWRWRCSRPNSKHYDEASLTCYYSLGCCVQGFRYLVDTRCKHTTCQWRCDYRYQYNIMKHMYIWHILAMVAITAIFPSFFHFDQFLGFSSSSLENSSNWRTYQSRNRNITGQENANLFIVSSLFMLNERRPFMCSSGHISWMHS